MLKLNLGSGSAKIPGYINIDSEKECKPDLVLDFTAHSLPYKVESVDEILLFHCLEHIQKDKHYKLLKECARVLKLGGRIYISYPNFWECAQRWHQNTAGLKKFWEATIYGRQLYQADYHVCIVDPDELALLLFDCGFTNVRSLPEPDEMFNSVTAATKIKPPVPSYETLVTNDMRSMKVVER